MKNIKLYLKLLLVGIFCTFQACQNDTPIDYLIPDEDVSILNKDRMNIIADLSKKYENAIIEALSERNQLRQSGISTATFDISERINTLFELKSNEYLASLPEVSTKSLRIGYVVDENILHTRLYQLQDQWLALPYMQDIDDEVEFEKEHLLAEMQKIADDIVVTIKNDDSLNEAEKQVVIENIVFRTNLIITTIHYGDEITDFYASIQLRNWFRRNAARIRCTAQSIIAAAACTTAAVSTATGPAAIALWAVCTAQTLNATACWASI